MAHWRYKLQTRMENHSTWVFLWSSNEGGEKPMKNNGFLSLFPCQMFGSFLRMSAGTDKASKISVILCSYWFSCWIPGSLHWSLPIYGTSMFIYRFDQKSNFGGHLLISSLEKITSNSFLNKKSLWVTWITLALRDTSLTPLSCLKCSISSHSPNLKQK